MAPRFTKFAKFLFLENIIIAQEKEKTTTTTSMILSTLQKQRKVREAQVEAESEERLVRGKDIEVTFKYGKQINVPFTPP